MPLSEHSSCMKMEWILPDECMLLKEVQFVNALHYSHDVFIYRTLV